MRITVIAATLAMLVSAPLVASAADGVSGTNTAVVTARRPTTQQPVGYTRPPEWPIRPQFVGPFELHHGLLPNGLMPVPFNYG
jgi:hypothetical protein